MLTLILVLIAAAATLAPSEQGDPGPVAILKDGPYAGLEVEVEPDQTTIVMRPLQIDGDVAPGLVVAHYRRSNNTDRDGRPVFIFDSRP